MNAKPITVVSFHFLCSFRLACSLHPFPDLLTIRNEFTFLRFQFLGKNYEEKLKMLMADSSKICAYGLQEFLPVSFEDL
jgi:hypothetical protein